MDKEFLSQDEVDALLQGVDDDDTPAAPDKPVAEARPCNLATQERIVRGRMATLETINERFVPLFKTALFNLLQRSAEVRLGPVKTTKYSEFIGKLTQPANLNLVQLKPLRGTALFVLDPELVFLLVDNMFGGDGRFQTQVGSRELTPTELRIVRRLLQAAFENMEKCWQQVYPIECEYLRSESSPTFINIAGPNDVVLTYTVKIEVGNASGEFHVCLPYAMIEPIRDLLANSVQESPLEVDRRWVKQLANDVQIAEVELVAFLGNGTLTLKQIMGLKAGDFISVEVPEAITAEVGGVPVMECRYGISNGRYALKVQKMIDHRNNGLGGMAA